MLETAILPSITTVTLPERYDVDIYLQGIHVRQRASPAIERNITVEAFRSRGQICRRALLSVDDGTQLVLELGSFSDAYELPITGTIRARSATVKDGVLVLEDAQYRSVAVQFPAFIQNRDAILDSWHSGIRYRPELLNEDGSIRQSGLRRPQIGALHAIASLWTLSKEKAIIVMPTGTGKTEVMIASSIAAASNRVLIIVPTDALRQQTADKFLTYGLLHTIGVIEDLPTAVVGSLSSAPQAENIAAANACNIVVTTMNSVGLADEATQRQFAALFSHVFFDEAHHTEANTWKQFQTYCTHASVLLFTATPYREDGKAIDGKIIYNFPLSAAQEQLYFRPIHFLEVFQPDAKLSHQAIAECAVARLREDLAAGLNHMLMARASTIDQAKHLFNTIYSTQYADLNPVLVYSKS
jgi:hypothetical protein